MMRKVLWAPFPLQCSVLIASLSQIDDKCSPHPFPPPVVTSHYILIKHIIRKALWAPFPPAVFISYFPYRELMRTALLDPCLPSPSINFFLHPR